MSGKLDDKLFVDYQEPLAELNKTVTPPLIFCRRASLNVITGKIFTEFIIWLVLIVPVSTIATTPEVAGLPGTPLPLFHSPLVIPGRRQSANCMDHPSVAGTHTPGTIVDNRVARIDAVVLEKLSQSIRTERSAVLAGVKVVPLDVYSPWNMPH